MGSARTRDAITGLLLAGLLAGGCAPQAGPPTSGDSGAAPPDTSEYVALGTEPFWSLKVTRGGIVFSEPGDPEGVRGEYAPPDRAGDSLTFRTVLEDAEATSVELTLRAEPCSDGMSDRRHPYSAVARVGGRVLRGCAERNPIVHERSAIPDQPELGDWVIVGHLRAGPASLPDSAAAHRHGSVVHLGLDRAAFGADNCLEPTYRSTRARADSLLGSEFQVAPAALGIDPNSIVTLVRVQCAESHWASPGGTLLRSADDRWFAVWEGTFFELRRWDPEAAAAAGR